MSDDIVTRLREPNFNSDLDLFSIMSEAADEIERLRLQVKEWRQIADVCVMAIGVPENETDKLAMRLYDKAVRSD